jgi:hypothetical protein
MAKFGKNWQKLAKRQKFAIFCHTISNWTRDFAPRQKKVAMHKSASG